MKYRIVPLGVTGWAVQTRAWWFPIWYYESKMVGYDTYELIEFRTMDEAEEWIWSDMLRRHATRNAKRMSRARRRNIQPLEYPPDSHSSTNKSS
jgi:hypothetical protein